MKLLSTFANKDKQQEEITRKLLRSQEIEELASKANAKLARAEADFADALARSKEIWSIHIEKQQKINSELEKETIALENRKKQALIPIQMYREEVDKVMLEAQEIVQRAKEKKENADYLTEILEEKLTEVADRESILLSEEQRIEIAKNGIEIQKEQTKEGIVQLSKKMILFHENQQEYEANINERKKELALAEISLNAKLGKYQRDLEALKIWDIQLKDERGTLDREFNRLKIK